MDTRLSRLQKMVAEAASAESVGPEEDIYEAGIDSMAAMDLMLAVEEEFGVTLDERFLQARTASQILELVSGGKQ